MRGTRKERSDAKVYEYNGKALTIKEWARELNITERGLRYRIAWGWTDEELFSPNMHEKKLRSQRRENTDDLRDR